MSQFQLFEELTPSEFKALKDDIERHGVQVPIEVDEHGTILDGHHRDRACRELGITDYPKTHRIGFSLEEKEEHVVRLNLRRRHLNSEQKRHWIEWLLERHPDWTDRRAAGELGVSHVTVAAVRAAGGQNVQPSGKRTGKDGKKYPGKPSVTSHTKREDKRAQAVLASVTPDDLPPKHVDLKRAERIAREKAAEERRQQPVEIPDTDADTQLFHGDFRDLGWEPGSVDLIFTDPPYPAEFLPLWSDLAAFAAEVLTDTGMLVAYSGHFHLPEVLDRMRAHLRYVWCGSLVTFGAHNNVHPVHVRTRSKPLLFFAKPSWKPDAWFDDTFSSEGREKDLHDWQQSVGAARYYIETLSTAGGLVVDPFLGSGTTAVAAKELGRRFIGCDVDADAVASAQGRVA